MERPTELLRDLQRAACNHRVELVVELVVEHQDVMQLCAYVERLERNHMPHMCRMDHVEIRHADSEHEECPLCRAEARVRELEELAASAYSALVGREVPWGDEVEGLLMTAASVARKRSAEAGA